MPVEVKVVTQALFTLANVTACIVSLDTISCIGNNTGPNISKYSVHV